MSYKTGDVQKLKKELLAEKLGLRKKRMNCNEVSSIQQPFQAQNQQRQKTWFRELKGVFEILHK